jgi:hypothetical protein
VPPQAHQLDEPHALGCCKSRPASKPVADHRRFSREQWRHGMQINKLLILTFSPVYGPCRVIRLFSACTKASRATASTYTPSTPTAIPSDRVVSLELRVKSPSFGVFWPQEEATDPASCCNLADGAHPNKGACLPSLSSSHSTARMVSTHPVCFLSLLYVAERVYIRPSFLLLPAPRPSCF